MKLFKKLTALVSAAVLAAAAIPAMPAAEVKAAGTKSAKEITAEMGLGWNLGNSLDTNGTGDNSEEYWGNPATTKELIQFVHKQGFSSIRIPVTWGYHMDASHKIDPSYMKRVKEVVDYAYDDGMYVIINIHHDNFELGKDTEGKNNNNYFFPDNAHLALSETFVKSVWSQVSETFKDYDQHLVFETLNEPRRAGDNSTEWWFNVDDPPAVVNEAISVINTLNQDAVDVIRASGGNNKTRLIMCPGYDASLDGATVAGYKKPNDSMVGVSIHAYVPYNFAMNTNEWEGAVSVYNDEMKNQLNGIFSTIKSKVVDKGYACYIGEFGATNKSNDTERCKWAEDYTAKAKALGIPVFLWDNNIYGTGDECFGMINRTELKVAYPEYLNSIKKAYPVNVSKRLAGDVNDDGKVDISDVTVLKQSIAGWNVKINKSNADVTGDGEVSLKDVVLLKQFLANWNVTLK